MSNGGRCLSVQGSSHKKKVEELPRILPDILRCPCGFAIAPSAYKMEWPDAAGKTAKIVEECNPEYLEYSYACVECERFIINRHPTKPQ